MCMIAEIDGPNKKSSGILDNTTSGVGKRGGAQVLPDTLLVLCLR